jgi:hypothetical protein
MDNTNYQYKLEKYKIKYQKLTQNAGNLNEEKCLNVPFLNWGYPGRREDYHDEIIKLNQEVFTILNAIDISQYKNLVIHFAGKCYDDYEEDGIKKYYFNFSCEEMKKFDVFKSEKTLVLSLDPNNINTKENKNNFDIFNLKMYISSDKDCYINIKLLDFIDNIVSRLGQTVLIDSLSKYPELEQSDEISLKSIDTLRFFYQLTEKYSRDKYFIFKELFLNYKLIRKKGYINNYLDFVLKNTKIDIYYYLYNLSLEKYKSKSQTFQDAYKINFKGVYVKDILFINMKNLGIKFSDLFNYVIKNINNRDLIDPP